MHNLWYKIFVLDTRILLSAGLKDKGRGTMKKAIVYTVSNCPACLKLKKDWAIQGTEFEEKQVDQNQTFLNEALKYGDTVPIIVYGDGHIDVGYANMIG